MSVLAAVLALAGICLLFAALYQLGSVVVFREPWRASRGVLLLATSCGVTAGANACERYWPAVVILGGVAVLAGAGWVVLRRKRPEKHETSARP